MTRGQGVELRIQLNMQRSKIRAIIMMNMVMIQMRAAQTEDERAARRAQDAAQHAEVKI